MGVGGIRRLRQLEEENAKLKRVVADLTLDKVMLQDILKKRLKAGVRRELAKDLQARYRAGKRSACSLVDISRSAHRYRRD